jgi:hypothetical protein
VRRFGTSLVEPLVELGFQLIRYGREAIPNGLKASDRWLRWRLPAPMRDANHGQCGCQLFIRDGHAANKVLS